MIATIVRGKVTIEVAKALERVKGDAVIDGELVALDTRRLALPAASKLSASRGETAVSRIRPHVSFASGYTRRAAGRSQKVASRHPARHGLIAFSPHRKTFGTKYFQDAERHGLEGIMAKRAESPYVSGGRSADWLKIKTSKRQEVVITGFTAPRRTRPFFGALVLAMREMNGWGYIGHVGTGFSHKALEEMHSKLVKLKSEKSPFSEKIKDEALTTWVQPSLVAEVSSPNGRTLVKCGIRYISVFEPASRLNPFSASTKSRARNN